MTPEQQADHEEALRRIDEAEQTGATALDLWGFDFDPALLQRIGKLTALQSLDLGECEQIASIEPLASLTSLQSLDLGFCKQIVNIEPLALLAGLQSLDLSGCEQIASIEPLAALTSLQSLDLGFCKQIVNIEPLALLAGLQSLDLSYCDRIDNFEPLANLFSLQSLYLQGCDRIASIEPLASLVCLESLDLDWCDRFTSTEPLANLFSLQSLSLQGCKQVGSIEPLAGLGSLKSLDLNGCEQIDSIRPLASLTSLQSLDLTGCNQIAGIEPLTSLTSLQSLNLNWCNEITKFEPLASLDGLQSLDLTGCNRITSIEPLASLIILQSLDLSDCRMITSIKPLASLANLRSLDLSQCDQITSLEQLASLVSLKALRIQGCPQLKSFAPVLPLLPSLQELVLFGSGFTDLDSSLCGSEAGQNVLENIRSHFQDLDAGADNDAEVKVLLLGNGSAGKTQLSRRLRDLDYDPTIPTTHGIQLESAKLALDPRKEPIRLNLWDFGGQEVYHGTHSLFIQGRAVFLLLWTPELESASAYIENGLEMAHRPLAYWLDYLRAFAGLENPVIVIQSKCDTWEQQVRDIPSGDTGDFEFLQFEQVSAKEGLGLDELNIALKKAVRESLRRRPALPMGIGRAQVRDRLRKLLQDHPKENRALDRAQFDHICDQTGGISNKDAFLDFLHHSGVVFHRPGIFADKIVLDQNWALEAIYTLFDRAKVLPLLRGHGRFTRAELEFLVWSGYSSEEQKIFLGMMQSCGICFPARQLPDGETEYIAPELLPEWSEARRTLLAAPLESLPPTAEAEACYPFLHEGILRNYLSRIGQFAADAAVYWRYGFTFYEETTASSILVQSTWSNAASRTGPGTLRFRAWGGNASQLIQTLLEELTRLPFGRQPTVMWKIGQTFTPERLLKETAPQLSVPTSPHPAARRKRAYISYAWGDNSSETAMQREALVDGACAAAASEGWEIVRDKDAMRTGDRISDFIRLLTLSELIIVVLSDKYLRSAYCMQELAGIYRHANSDSQEFQRRIVPLIFPDAKTSDWRYRAEIARYWSEEFQQMERQIRHLGQEDLRLYWLIKDWHASVGDMIRYAGDLLTPRGFEAIAKNNYTALREMLAKRLSEP